MEIIKGRREHVQHEKKTDFWTNAVDVRVFVHLQELRVDLELGDRPALLGGGLSPLLDASEQVVDGSGNDTELVVSDVDVEARPHGVRLTRTRLDKEQKSS